MLVSEKQTKNNSRLTNVTQLAETSHIKPSKQDCESHRSKNEFGNVLTDKKKVNQPKLETKK